MSVELHVSVGSRDISYLSRCCPHVEHVDSLVAVGSESCVLCEPALVVCHVASEHASELDVKLETLPSYRCRETTAPRSVAVLACHDLVVL